MEAQWDRPPHFDPVGTPPPVQTEPLDIEVGYRVRTADSVKPGDPFALRVLVADSGCDDPEFSVARDWLAGQLKGNNRHRIAARDTYRLAQAQRGFGRAAQSGYMGLLVGSTVTIGVKSAEWLFDTFGISTYTGLLRWRYRTYWKRDDAIRQISKNNTDKYVKSSAVGVSDTTLREVAQTLGIELGVAKGPKLSTT